MQRRVFRINELVLLYDMLNEGFITAYSDSDNHNHNHYRFDCPECIDPYEYNIIIGQKYSVCKNIDPILSIWKIGFNIPSNKYYFIANRSAANYLSDNLQYTHKVCKNKFHLSSSFTAHCLFDIDYNCIIENHASNLEHIKVIRYTVPSLKQLRKRETYSR